MDNELLKDIGDTKFQVVHFASTEDCLNNSFHLQKLLKRKKKLSHSIIDLLDFELKSALVSLLGAEECGDFDWRSVFHFQDLDLVTYLSCAFAV